MSMERRASPPVTAGETPAAPLLYLCRRRKMPRKLNESRRLQKRAEQLIPGGVNSPVRAFKAVECDAPFLVRGLGSRVWDADGNEYIDYVGSWGPLILGHADPGVLDAILGAAGNGTSFGASTPAEADLAELVIEDGVEHSGVGVAENERAP